MTLTPDDHIHLARAVALSREHMHAGAGGPFGSVVVRDGRVIGEGGNQVTSTNDPTAHAEMVAIRNAATRLGQPRLDGCTLWVTLEPCAMCAAAISLARVEAVRFAADDPKGGGIVHGARIFAQPTCHHRPDVIGGLGEVEAATQLRQFFAARRPQATLDLGNL